MNPIKIDLNAILAKVAEQNRAKLASMGVIKNESQKPKEITATVVFTEDRTNKEGVSKEQDLPRNPPPREASLETFEGEGGKVLSEFSTTVLHSEDKQTNAVVPYTSIGELVDSPEYQAEREEEVASWEAFIAKLKEQKQRRNTPVDADVLFRDIPLSDEQLQACINIVNGESCCLVGKAGTGKTYTIVEFVKAIMRSHRAVPMRDIDGHKWLKAGSFGVVVIAFTNRAINNISKRFDLTSTPINFMTAHKLLEYMLEEYYVEDPETRQQVQKWRFAPTRHKFRKFPSGIHTIVFEESSMISKDDLHQKIVDACHPGVQMVYLGDLQQIPPIYGKGILGYKINELPVYELTKIFRQAADNPIISLAWDIASGKKLTKTELNDKFNTSKSLDAPIRITFFDKKIDWENATVVMGRFFCNLVDRKVYDPAEDIILVPYNKQLGSIELNKAIAQHISERDQHPTHEVIAGFQKHYYAVGDKVLYTKKEGYITKITKNGKYIGRGTLPPSTELHRDGTYHPRGKDGVKLSPEEMSPADMDNFMQNVLNSAAEDDISNQASHIISVRLVDQVGEGDDADTDDDGTLDVVTRGEYANLELAYAITIHKSQGSEWRKVFLLIHNSHYNINREMLYTAVTRASKQLFVMCEGDSFAKAVERQRIVGNTLEEKKAWFKKEMEKEERNEADKRKKGVDEDELDL